MLAGAYGVVNAVSLTSGVCNRNRDSNLLDTNGSYLEAICQTAAPRRKIPGGPSPPNLSASNRILASIVDGLMLLICSVARASSRKAPVETDEVLAGQVADPTERIELLQIAQGTFNYLTMLQLPHCGPSKMIFLAQAATRA